MPETVRYRIYSEQGRNRTPHFEFSFGFQGEPRAGDVIQNHEERWIVDHRLWEEEAGACVLIAHRRSGVVQA